MGSIIGSEPGADVIQASWADPVGVEMSKHTEEQHVASSSGANLDME